MKRELKFTVLAITWFDGVNGNTYHSVRCIRHEDNAIAVGSFRRYGYGDHYKQTALSVMFDSGWFPEKYRPYSCLSNTRKKTGSGNLYLYDQENSYPIIWIVLESLKHECIANGEL